VWLDITSGRYENSQYPWLARLPFGDGWNRRVCGNFLCVKLHQQQNKSRSYLPGQTRVGTDASSVQPSETRRSGCLAPALILRYFTQQGP
jgi:hypothetical protein